MNDISATIGIEQLKYIDEIVSKHIDNQEYYDCTLQNIKGVTVIKKPDVSRSSSWLYTLHIDKRDLFSVWMSEQGVMTSRVHERNDKHTAFSDSLCELPGVDAFNASQVSIPVGWWITREDREYIASKVQEFSDLYLLN